MAYQTGTATNIIDLLDKLRAFALSIGWTVHRFDSGTDGWLAISHSSAGYFNLRDGGSNELDIVGATGYDAGQTFTNQPGADPYPTRTNELGGPFTAYHFYGTTQYLHVVVEVLPGQFRHFNVGLLDKIGSWTGGEYVCGTYWSQSLTYIDDQEAIYHAVPFDFLPYWALSVYNYGSRIRAAIDARASEWRPFMRPTNYQGTEYGGYMMARGSMRGYKFYYDDEYLQLLPGICTPNTFNGISPLTPIMVLLDRTGDTQRSSPAGYPPDMRYVSMKNLTPGQQITVGADAWDCYPLARRTDDPSTGSDQENSYHYGIAYKRVA